MLEKITQIAESTIGFDLVSIEPSDDTEIPEEPEHPADEHWMLAFGTDGWKWVKQELDREGEEFDTPKYPFSLDKLSVEDVDKLRAYGYLDALNNPPDDMDFYFRGDDHLHMVTSRETWLSLSGRHWVYDLKTKEVRLIALS